MATQRNLTERERLEQQYSSARANLLLMLALTVVNVVLLLMQSDSMLLFSATIPYVAAIDAWFAYQYGLAANMTIFVVCVAIAAGSILLYLLCWWLSKKHVGWMITALVLFLLDTVFMIYLYVAGQDASGILDTLIHFWVIYYLVIGCVSAAKLKKLPPETAAPSEDDAAAGQTPQ